MQHSFDKEFRESTGLVFEELLGLTLRLSLLLYLRDKALTILLNLQLGHCQRLL